MTYIYIQTISNPLAHVCTDNVSVYLIPFMAWATVTAAIVAICSKYILTKTAPCSSMYEHSWDSTHSSYRYSTKYPTTLVIHKSCSKYLSTKCKHVQSIGEFKGWGEHVEKCALARGVCSFHLVSQWHGIAASLSFSFSYLPSLHTCILASSPGHSQNLSCSWFRFILTEPTISGPWRSNDPRPSRNFSPQLEIKSGSALGTRLHVYTT